MRIITKRTSLIAGALTVLVAGAWFAWDRGALDPDDHEPVSAALDQAGDDDLARVQGVIAVFDEQVTRKRSGWRRHGPWRFHLSAYADALDEFLVRAPASPAARSAAVWLIQYDRGPAGRRAILVLHEHHMASTPPELLAIQPHEEARDLLAAQVHELPDESSRARAQFALARWHLAIEKAARGADKLLALSDPDAQSEYAFWYGGLALVKFAEGRDPEAEHAAAVELLADLRPRVDDLFPPEQADKVEGLMVRYLDLDVGSVAPEIVGTDLEGREMRLSDFRGKVVVLDFWGDW